MSFAWADEELQAADELLRIDLPRVAVSCADFACIHAMRALLQAYGLEPKTHQGTLHLFQLHFVKPGMFDPAAGRLLARLQKYREEADYAEAFVVDADGARQELDHARAFVARVRTHTGQVT